MLNELTYVLAICGVVVAAASLVVASTALLFRRIDRRLDDMRTYVDARFDALETRYDARFDAADARFDVVDARFDAVDRRLDEAREERLGLAKRIDDNTRLIGDLRQDVGRLEGVVERTYERRRARDIEAADERGTYQTDAPSDADSEKE